MSNAAVRNFIEDHSLKRADGVTLCDAFVSFYDEKGSLSSIASEIQIVHIAGTAVLYIIEAPVENFPFPDMYATDKFHFAYSNGMELEIRADQRDNRFLISVKPVK